MENKFKQLKLEPPIMGLCAQAATLKLLPNDFHKKFNIQFEEGEDGLDYFKGAKIQIDETFFELINYFRAPVNNTCINVMKTQSFERQARDLRKFLDTFGLTKYDLTWIHPELYEIKF